MNLSVGTYRHLQESSDSRRVFAILAVDHRDNLIAEMQNYTAHKIMHKDIVALKSSVARHVASSATALLTDPDYGMAGIAHIPGDIGLLAPLEVTDYSLDMSERQPRLIPGWSIAKLKQAGFCGAKLLVYYHPESKDAAAKTQLVDTLVVESQLQHVPLYLEPVSYSLDPNRPLSTEEHRQIVIETAHHFSRRGITALMAEFPVDPDTEQDENIWMSALEDLNKTCSVPWVLLNATLSFDILLRQATLACRAGASGVIGGQAVWAEAVALEGEARENFLATTARERMEQLAAVAHALGTPWTSRYLPPDVGERWYATGRH